jgi:hypothetical protein
MNSLIILYYFNMPMMFSIVLVLTGEETANIVPNLAGLSAASS